MRYKNTSKTSPIILIDRSSDPYLEPEQPILLHQNGDISCNGIFLKNTPRTRYFRDYYEMMLDYLTGKKMRLNVTYFRKKDLGDVIEEMQSNNDKTISLKKLIGPSFILLALGLGSGEVILWPYLAANYGLGIIWGAWAALPGHLPG